MRGTLSSRRHLSAGIARLRRRVAKLEEIEARHELADKELRRRGEFSEAILDSLKDIIYVVDAETYKIVYCNHAFLDQYGLSENEVIGRTCHEVTRQSRRPCAGSGQLCPALSTLRTGQPTLAEHCLLDLGGEKIFLECATLPVLDESGEVAHVIHVDRDVSERKWAEEQLRQANQEFKRSNAFLFNLIMSSVHAVIAADMTGRIQIFNAAAGQITGYTEAEALGSLDIRDLYPGDGAREVMRKLRSDEYGGPGKIKALEVELRRKDGNLVPIALSAAIVCDGRTEVGTVGFFYDLREKRRMEEELNKTRIQLLQAEKMASIGKLAAGVAHQLNNPLAGIIIFAKLLLEEYALEPRAQADVTRILEDAERCSGIVKELLQFARQSGNEIRPSGINEALSRTLFLLHNQSLFHGIEIVTNYDDDIPRIHADIQQLNQAFMNIFLNAAEAMDGRGRLTVSTRTAPEGDRVVVEISDTGAGIPEDVLPHIFEPFFTTKEEGKGTGLGLSVAYGIIEHHQGRISVRSRPGQGATFILELPIRPSTGGGGSGDL